MNRARTCLAAVLAFGLLQVAASCGDPVAPLPVGGSPLVDPADFDVSVFASGLDFPLGLAVLGDGSLAVGSTPVSFFGGSGQVLRFEDTDGDDVADGTPDVLVSGLPGAVVSVRRLDRIAVVSTLGATTRLTVFRVGAGADDAWTELGFLELAYPIGWRHMSVAIALRASLLPEASELVFSVGSDGNAIASADPVAVTGALETSVTGDSLYLVTLSHPLAGDFGASDLTRIASGLRNPAGIAFDPDNGDLVFQDNGIDGTPVTEPESGDELNRLPAADIGGAVEDYGFPDSYVRYRTGEIVGGLGIAPEVVFQPIPDPQTGAEAEGANDVVFAPPDFPPGLDSGVFVGFHGQFSSGGLANEENPLVHADPASGDYFHLVANDVAGVGHLDGLASTRDALYVADLAASGGLGSTHAGNGSVHVIRARDGDGDGVPDAKDGCIEMADPLQGDADGDGYGDFCDGDFGQDGFVGGRDFDVFLLCFNRSVGAGGPPDDPTCAESDMNGDDLVGGPDFDLFLQGFNGPPGPSALAP